MTEPRTRNTAEGGTISWDIDGPGNAQRNASTAVSLPANTSPEPAGRRS